MKNNTLNRRFKSIHLHFFLSELYVALFHLKRSAGKLVTERGVYGNKQLFLVGVEARICCVRKHVYTLQGKASAVLIAGKSAFTTELAGIVREGYGIVNLRLKNICTSTFSIRDVSRYKKKSTNNGLKYFSAYVN